MYDIPSVLLTTLVREFRLEVVNAASDYEKIGLTVVDVARPGLQLAGYYDHFEPMRLQVIGNAEFSYLQKLSITEREGVFDRLFSCGIPALLIARGLQPDSQCLEMAKKHNITILSSKEATSAVVSAIIAYLNSELAPSITRHGVLVEVYGEGLLLLGESGIGKSEVALELIKRGHRMVTDDAVEIRKVSDDTLVGSAPVITKHLIELRGIGIVDVKSLFGVQSVKETQNIDLVITLEEWDKKKEYDRLGLEEEYTEFLGNKVQCHTIPIRPGRNLAVIVESTAINHRQKEMGYNAAQELYRRLQESMTRRD